MRLNNFEAVIFDIDGTLMDHTHRLPLIAQGRPGGKDWKAFHAACCDDPPIKATCLVARALYRANVPLIFITGRAEFQRKATQRSLIQHVFGWTSDAPSVMLLGPHQINDGPPPWLAMRGNDDDREDTIVKGEILDLILLTTPYRPILAFEDRPRIVDLWHRRGLTVAKIGEWTEAQQAPASEAWAK